MNENIKLKIRIVCPHCGNPDSEYVRQISVDRDNPEYCCDLCVRRFDDKNHAAKTKNNVDM